MLGSRPGGSELAPKQLVGGRGVIHVQTVGQRKTSPVSVTRKQGESR